MDKEALVLEAYGRYDSDPRALDRDDYDAFKAAVEPLAVVTAAVRDLRDWLEYVTDLSRAAGVDRSVIAKLEHLLSILYPSPSSPSAPERED